MPENYAVVITEAESLTIHNESLVILFVSIFELLIKF